MAATSRTGSRASSSHALPQLFRIGHERPPAASIVARCSSIVAPHHELPSMLRQASADIAVPRGRGVHGGRAWRRASRPRSERAPIPSLRTRPASSWIELQRTISNAPVWIAPMAVSCAPVLRPRRLRPARRRSIRRACRASTPRRASRIRTSPRTRRPSARVADQPAVVTTIAPIRKLEIHRRWRKGSCGCPPAAPGFSTTRLVDVPGLRLNVH